MLIFSGVVGLRYVAGFLPVSVHDLFELPADDGVDAAEQRSVYVACGRGLQSIGLQEVKG